MWSAVPRTRNLKQSDLAAADQNSLFIQAFRSLLYVSELLFWRNVRQVLIEASQMSR